jgi:hypothetical protein
LEQTIMNIERIMPLLVLACAAASLTGGCGHRGGAANAVSVEQRIKTAPPQQAERMRRDMQAAERIGRAQERHIQALRNMRPVSGGNP